MRRIVWLLGAVLVGGWWLHGCPRGTPAGRPIDWSGDPIQVDGDRPPFVRETGKGTVTFHPRATFDASGVVAAAEPYRFDEVAFLAPVDVVLTWGRLPVPPYSEKVSYSQMTRYYFWRTGARDLDLDYIQRHSSNMHLIPADPNLAKAVRKIASGDRVRIEGFLVDVATDRGLTWKTSLTRDDSGPGACEVIWVEALQINDRQYR
jgi:hypothetical protein